MNTRASIITSTALCLALLCSVAAIGQHRHEHVFAFIQNKEGRAGLKPATAYKYDVTLAVFNDLLRARGDFRQQAPELVMNNGEQFVAWMDPENARIGIEERAYDVCAALGPDSLHALAALLGHELIHYYEKHDWSRNFIHANEPLDAAQKINQLDEGIKQETQADCLGGFLAFSAGYNVYNLMPRLLEKLYQSYGLPEKLPGYPSLTDRVEITKTAMLELRDLQTVFEVAQYLSLLEKYEESAQYYRHILQSFQSREIYNNAGVNLALAALSLFSMSEMPYVLPLEPDPNSRLHNLKGGPIAERLKLREALLDQALEQLDRAIIMDPAYAPGFLNKACVFALRGEWDDAEFWLKKGKRLGNASMATDFTVLEGMLAALQNDTTEAQNLWRTAQAKGNLLADVNLDILAGRPRDLEKTTATALREKINGATLDDFLRAPEVEKEISISSKVIAGVKRLPQSKVWMHYADDGKQYAVVHWCAEGCDAPTQNGIRNGADAIALTAAYGQAPRMIARPDGVVWVYPAANLLFHLNREGKVQGWGAYRKA
jgi:tetratricopeptide (TPR) repeat protein